MKSKGTKLAIAGLVVAGLLVGGALPAGAGTDGTKRTLALVGSDTTSLAMEGLSAAYNENGIYNPDRDRAVNVPPLHSVSANVESGEATSEALDWIAGARRSWPAGAVVPADGDCSYETVYGGNGAIDANQDGDQTDGGDSRYTSVTIDANDDGDTTDTGETIRLGRVAPNGSGSGRAALLDFTTNSLGCLDIGRSSSAPSASQQPSFDTWAMALDAVSPVAFATAPHGVTDISQSQLNKIYTCSPANVDNSLPADGDFTDVGDYQAGKPFIRQWGALSGNPADTDAIAAYRVQKGSGTGNDVAALLIGLTDPDGSGPLGPNDAIGTNCTDPDGAGPLKPDSIYPVVQEHDCSGVATIDKPDALCFYGYSRYRIQSKALEADKRNGTKFIGFYTGTNTPLTPSGLTIKEDASGRFEGTRLVYNVILRENAATDTGLNSFRDALTFVGVQRDGGFDVNGDGDLTDAWDVPDPGASAKPGFVCAGGMASKVLRNYGLIPLKLANTDAGDSNYGQSYCRHNKYSL